MKRPKLKRDWVGLKVRALTMLRNGYVEIHPGAVGTVTKNFSGLSISFEVCPHCKVAPHITRVSESSVCIV